MSICFSCKKELSTVTAPGRGSECTNCGADVKVCLNCRFYDRASYNECTEPNAERVVEKERANFCEYFQFSTKSKESTATSGPDSLAELKKLLSDK